MQNVIWRVENNNLKEKEVSFISEKKMFICDLCIYLHLHKNKVKKVKTNANQEKVL